MSGSWQERAIVRKAVQRGIVDARPVGGKKRQCRKDVVVEVRYPNLFGLRDWAATWHKFGAYATREIAEQVIANKTRGHSGTTRLVEYRIKP